MTNYTTVCWEVGLQLRRPCCRSEAKQHSVVPLTNINCWLFLWCLLDWTICIQSKQNWEPLRPRMVDSLAVKRPKATHDFAWESLFEIFWWFAIESISLSCHCRCFFSQYTLRLCMHLCAQWCIMPLPSPEFKITKSQLFTMSSDCERISGAKNRNGCCLRLHLVFCSA